MDENNTNGVDGIAAVRSAISHITGVPIADLSQDDGITWFEAMQQDLLGRGWTLHKEEANVAVKAPHVGIFSVGGQLYAAVFERNELTFNPTAIETVNAGQLIQRLRVAEASTPSGA